MRQTMGAAPEWRLGVSIFVFAAACTETPAQPPLDAAPQPSTDALDASEDPPTRDVPGDDGASIRDVLPEGRPDVARDVVQDAAEDLGPPPIIDDECQPPVATITVPGPEHRSSMTFTGISWVSRVCGVETRSAEGHYTVRVTQRSVVSISAGRNPIGLRRNCNDRTSEFVCARESVGEGIRTLLEPGTYSLVVDNTFSGGTTADLRVWSAAPAANGACDAPADIPLGTTLTARNTTGAWVAHCRASYRPMLRYRVTVPPRRAALVTAERREAGAGRLTVQEARGCDPTATCGDRRAEAIEPARPFSIGFNNATDAPSTEEFVVYQTEGETSFSIGGEERAGGSHCRLSRPLTPGAAMTGQDVRTGGTGNFGWCLTALGPQLFYSLVVPPNRRAVVTATPTGTPWAPTIQLIESCSGTTCYSIRNGTPGMPTAATYEERVGIERTVLIGVAAPEGTTGGTFDLSAAIMAL